MNRNQLTILLVIALVVGAAGLLLRKKESGSWNSSNVAMGKKPLGDLPINDVAEIVLKQGTNELHLSKKSDLWRVRERNDYPANYSEISEFVLKARDLKIAQTEQVGPSQLPQLGLAPGQGTNFPMVIDFKDAAGKTLKSLVLGKKHFKKANRPSPMGMDDEGWPDGRYIKVGADSDSVALVSEAFANIEPKADQWLNKDFFHVEKVRSVAAAFPMATNSWKLTRDTENGEFKLVDSKPGEQLDSAKASGVVNPLSSPGFVDVLTSSKPEETGLDRPTVVTLETFEGFTYTLNIGQKTNDNYPLTLKVAAQLPKERSAGKDEKVEDKEKLDKEFKEKQKKLEEKLTQEKNLEKSVYLVSTWTVDPVLKDRSQLMAEKKEEPAKDASPAISVPPQLEDKK